MTTEPHAWELRQHERAREAAGATVNRLERALIEMESELDFRRVELGQIIAARHARGAMLFEASQRGACLIFGGAVGSPSTAAAAWDGVPPDAVRTVTDHIVQAPRLEAEERAALNAVADLESRALQAQRSLAHWRAVAGDGSPLSGSPSGGSPLSDSPTMLRAPVGPPESGAVEQAEAAAVAVADHEPPTATPPAAPFSTRLAELGRRVAGW